MKKVVFFIPSMGQGGAEKVFLNLANKMVDTHDVTLVLQDINGVLMSQLNRDIAVYHLEETNKFILVFRFIQFIESSKPDAVFSTLNIPNILNYLGRKLSKIQYRLITRQAAPFKPSNLPKIIAILLKKSFSNSDYVIANSNSTRDSLINLIPAHVSKIKTIYNPVYTTKFYELAKETELIPDFIRSKKFILCVGRLDKTKNFQMIINAFAESKSRNCYNLVILGEGSQRIYLENLIDVLKLKNRVFLVGNVSNPYPYYGSARLFVSSSLWEGFGNVIVEALSFNLPIICTESGAAREILEDEKYGIIVPVNDIKMMTEKIDFILQSDYVLGRHLIDRAENFSIERISNQYEDLIK